MKHWHHINPRHNGGGDEPENLILLSVPEHAEAHFLLYLEHGRREDWDAYHGLAGLIGKEELWLAAALRGAQTKLSEESKDKIRQAHLGKPKHTEESKAALRAYRLGTKQTDETKEKIRQSLIGNQRCLGNKLSEEHKAKLSEAGKGNSNAKGTNQKQHTEANKKRSEANKERWRKWRAERGLDPDEPLCPKERKKRAQQ